MFKNIYEISEQLVLDIREPSICLLSKNLMVFASVSNVQPLTNMRCYKMKQTLGYCSSLSVFLPSFHTDMFLSE